MIRSVFEVFFFMRIKFFVVYFFYRVFLDFIYGED